MLSWRAIVYHHSLLTFWLLLDILELKQQKMNSYTYILYVCRIISSFTQFTLQLNGIFVTVRANIHWEHKNPHKNTIKIIIKPTYLLLVSIHKYLLLILFRCVYRAQSFDGTAIVTAPIHLTVHECVPDIFNAIIISFVWNLNRPHEPYNILIRSLNWFMCVLFCMRTSISHSYLVSIDLNCYAVAIFYHFNFITILIANNDLKNVKNTINTTLIWHLWWF